LENRLTLLLCGVNKNTETMTTKIELTICLGSSCFSRGNGRTLAAIKEYLSTHQLEEKVFFKGELCTNNCNNGPILKINDNVFEDVDPLSINDLLNKELADIL